MMTNISLNEKQYFESTQSVENGKLFDTTAQYYSKYRLPYPQNLFLYLKDKYDLNGSGYCLDLGCGTGNLTVPLSEYFQKVVGTDISEAMIEEAKKSAQQQNIEWQCEAAENLSFDDNSFDTITIGSALHWMNKEVVLKKIFSWLKPGGILAIIGAKSIWNEKELWQKGGDFQLREESEKWQDVVVEIVRKWLGKQRKAGNDTYKAPTIHYEDLIKNFDFILDGKENFEIDVYLSCEEIIGYLYSTSFCNKSLLGDNVDAFEKDLTNALMQINSEDKFHKKHVTTAIFGKKCDA